MFEELVYEDGKLYRNGAEVGWLEQSTGYRRFSYNNTKYYTHRVVWFMHHDEWPKYVIDHTDGDKLNNKIENLRNTNQTVNQYNRKRVAYNSKTGVPGVYQNKKGKFIAQAWIDKKIKYLGIFETLEEAKETRQRAVEEVHEKFNTTPGGALSL